MPHPIDTLLVHLKDTLSEFGVAEDISASIGANAIVQILDAIYYASRSVLMHNYESSLDFRQAALEQGLQYEQWIRPQLGMPQVRSFQEQDEIIAGLATHLGDLILAIGVLKDELGYHGVGGRRGFAEIDASVARAHSFLRQFAEDEQPSEPLPPTRFEREPVL